MLRVGGGAIPSPFLFPLFEKVELLKKRNKVSKIADMKIFVLPLQAILTTEKLSYQLLSTFLLFVLRSFRRLQVGNYALLRVCGQLSLRVCGQLMKLQLQHNKHSLIKIQGL